MSSPNRESSDNGPIEFAPVVPIACSLSSQEARDRVARWSALVLGAKTNARAQRGLVRAEFRNEAAVRKELELLVTAERECCPFLQFGLSDTDTAVVLTITSLNAAGDDDLALLAPTLGLLTK